ncbi:MAG: hypothetical protein KDB27_02550 [Planctomycetales bacterium]|nr:hypothetical protein [Planctomycetales bacterium]
MNHDKPPTLAQEMQGIGSLFLWVSFASNLPLRTFSRVFGTMGPMVMLPYSIFIGYFSLLFFSTLIFGTDPNLYAFWFCYLSSMMSMLHIVMHIYNHIRGRGVHNHCTGLSWFNYIKRTGDPDLNAAHGDALFAAALAVVFYALESPSLGFWFVINIGLAYFAYFFVVARDTMRQTGVASSLVDNEYWLRLLKRAEQDMEDLE